MTIPPFDLGLVLPPFLGPEPGNSSLQSPYAATTEDLVHRFGTSPARNTLLRGLLEFRSALRAIGIISGFQWIDGSFVEDKERRIGEPPKDIDIVTVFERPHGLSDNLNWANAMKPHAALFNPAYCKSTYNCEAFYIDLGRGGKIVATLSVFWFGLFSHQRETFRWKGAVRCELGMNHVDSLADAELTRRGF